MVVIETRVLRARLLLEKASDPASVAERFAASQIMLRPGVAQTQAVLARELSGGSDEAAAPLAADAGDGAEGPAGGAASFAAGAATRNSLFSSTFRSLLLCLFQ